MTDAPANRPFTDPERASAAGKASAEARRRRKAASPETRALELIRSSVDKLTEELLDAALGKGAFVDLKATERLKALQRALEYGLGRPGAQREAEEAPADLPTGESLFGG